MGTPDSIPGPNRAERRTNSSASRRIDCAARPAERQGDPMTGRGRGNPDPQHRREDDARHRNV